MHGDSPNSNSQWKHGGYLISFFLAIFMVLGMESAGSKVVCFFQKNILHGLQYGYNFKTSAILKVLHIKTELQFCKWVNVKISFQSFM